MTPPTTHDPPHGRRAPPSDPDDGAPPPRGRPTGAPSDDASEAYDRLSHELRTPLNAILGYAELLLDGSAGPLSAQARECAAHIQAAGRHLLCRVEAWQGVRAAGGERGRAAGAGRTCAAAGSVELIGLLRVRLAVPVEPPTAALRLIDEAGRLERLADALADLLLVGDARWIGDAAAGTIAPAVALSIEDRGEAAGVALTLRRPAGAPPPCAPPPATAGLVEALVAEQGGAVERGDDGAVVLVWPSRLVLERRP